MKFNEVKRLRIFNYLVIVQVVFSGLTKLTLAKRNSGENLVHFIFCRRLWKFARLGLFHSIMSLESSRWRLPFPIVMFPIGSDWNDWMKARSILEMVLVLVTEFLICCWVENCWRIEAFDVKFLAHLLRQHERNELSLPTILAGS